ncbi:hypothetical protein ACJZ2D_000247 [Fusarium nematophilum]
MPIYLHLVRHAEGQHNLSRQNLQIHDPRLTTAGEAQCVALREAFPHHAAITHLVSSPMRRALQTCLLAFAPAVAAGTAVTALQDIQEVSTLPCDTGTGTDVLEQEADFCNGRVDFSLVDDDWNDKSVTSPWLPDVGRLHERAAGARRWLREMAVEAERSTAKDVHIGVVSHGAMLHYLSEDWTDIESGWTGWKNAEWRTYQFVNSAGDQDASILETEESWQRRKGGVERVHDSRRVEAQELMLGKLQRDYDLMLVKQKAGVPWT